MNFSTATWTCSIFSLFSNFLIPSISCFHQIHKNLKRWSKVKVTAKNFYILVILEAPVDKSGMVIITKYNVKMNASFSLFNVTAWKCKHRVVSCDFMKKVSWCQVWRTPIQKLWIVSLTYVGYRGISNKLRSFHNQLKTPCRSCNCPPKQDRVWLQPLMCPKFSQNFLFLPLNTPVPCNSTASNGWLCSFPLFTLSSSVSLCISKIKQFDVGLWQWGGVPGSVWIERQLWQAWCSEL